MTTPCTVQGGELWLTQVEMQSLYPLPGQEIECTASQLSTPPQHRQARRQCPAHFSISEFRDLLFQPTSRSVTMNDKESIPKVW